MKSSDKDQPSSQAAAAALQPAVNCSQHAALGREAVFPSMGWRPAWKPDPFSRLRAKIGPTETAGLSLMLEEEVINKYCLVSARWKLRPYRCP